MSRMLMSILSLGLLVVTGFAPSATLGQRIKVGTALKTNPVMALPMLAIEEGSLWKKHGLDAEWVPFAGEGAMNPAAATGAIQLGITDGAGAVRALALGLPAILVMHLGVKNDFGIWVRADSPIREPKDLRGKKMDVTRLGGSSHAYARAVGRALGIEKDVKLMASGGIREQVAGLKSGALDSVMLTFQAIASLAVKGEAREVLSVKDYLPREWINRVVYSRRDFVEQRPVEATRAVKTILEGSNFVMKNRAWAVEKMVTFAFYPKEAAEAIFPRLDYSEDGRISRQALDNVLQFLVKFGVVPKEKAPPVETLYTTRFTE